MVQYGHTAQGFGFFGAEPEVLGYLKWPQPDPKPAAWVSTAIGAGRAYVLPIHIASGIGDAFHTLVEAVLEHRDESSEEVPGYLTGLDLPGEVEQRRKIADMTAALEELEQAEVALIKPKMLLSHMSGGPLEQLVIEKLAFVLTGSGLLPADTVERFVEDFVLLDDDPHMRAIGEAKALASNIGFSEIDQLHRHRSRLLEEAEHETELTPADIPGILVVNTFRNDEALKRRLGEGVHDNIARHARRMNVLVLRSADLFQLVVRRLEGHDDSAELSRLILDAGGGWLEVTDELRLRPE